MRVRIYWHYNAFSCAGRLATRGLIGRLLPATFLAVAMTEHRLCEERSDAAVHGLIPCGLRSGLLRCARKDWVVLAKTGGVRQDAFLSLRGRRPWQSMQCCLCEERSEVAVHGWTPCGLRSGLLRCARKDRVALAKTGEWAQRS